MKKIIYLSLTGLLTGAWLFIAFIHYSGLNSLAGLTHYRTGLLGMRAPAVRSDTVVGGPGVEANLFVDTLDIPHIFGKDKNSVGFGIGYMHARERYFQMELTVNTVMGKLSAMLGEAAFESDKYWVQFGLEEKARQYLDTLRITEPGLYAYLNAYAAGVNTYLAAENKENRDPLYTIWDCAPGAWKPYYVLLVQWYMSHDLAFYDDYIDKQEILDKLPAGVREMLYPGHPGNQLDIIPGSSKAGAVQPEAALVKLFEPGKVNRYASLPLHSSLGSNNWVIGGAHTRSGELFLANDLHLYLTAPNIFYELHVSCPGWNAYGYSIPGVPLIVTGHNDKIAWGITNGGWDVTEQYLLKLNPQDSDEYWLDGRWKKMDKKEFVIGVKGAGSKVVTTRYTAFGPLVQKDSISYGLTWYPASSNTAVRSFWQIMQAGDWSDFRNALRSYDYPSQNFVFGDVRGNIGMICAGKMPVKPAHYGGGLLDGTHSVTAGFIPFDSLPCVYNPVRNYLFSANQEPEQGNYYFSSRWFDDLSRPKRIDQLLSDGRKMSREDIRQMQIDTKDIFAADLQAALRKYAADKKLSSNWESLRSWDGNLVPGSPRALFYKCFRQACWVSSRETAKRLQVRTAPGYDQWFHFVLEGKSVDIPAMGLRLDPAACFNDIVRMADSVYAALPPSIKSNSFVFDIPQMTLLPGLSTRVDDMGGNENTINVNYYAHPVIRTLIEADTNGIRSWMVNATGQTGRINERNYFQQLECWKKNRLHAAQFTPDPRKLSAIKYHLSFTGSK